MNIAELTKLAQKLLDLPIGEASKVVDNGCWKFVCHRYHDGWYCLWDATTFAKYQRHLGRDIGRVFRDPRDLVEFVIGNPSTQFVLEAQDISV